MKNRNVIITGCAGLIGQELVSQFIRLKANVIGIDCVEEYSGLSTSHYFMVDLADGKGVADAFTEINKRFGAPHVLVNNGAVAHLSKPIWEISHEEFEQVIGVNLLGTFYCSKSFVSLNRGQSYGRIINIASTRWNQNEPHWEAYGASKGGVVSFTQSLAVSLSETPITVNAISPGWIAADETDDLTPEDHAQHPSGRVGVPADIANAVLFLCQEENNFVNGHNWIIDGGMTKKMIYV